MAASICSIMLSFCASVRPARMLPSRATAPSPSAVPRGVSSMKKVCTKVGGAPVTSQWMRRIASATACFAGGGTVPAAALHR